MDDGVETPLKRRKVERTPNKSIKRRSSTDKCLPSSPRSPFIPSSQTTNNTIKKRSPSPISSSSSPYSPHSPHPSHSCYSYPSTPTHIASPPAHAISPQNSPNPLSIIRLSKKSSPNPYLNFAPVSVSPLLSPANPVPLSPNLSNATYTPNTTTTSTPFKFHSGKHPPEVISVKTIPPDEWKENFTPTTKTKTKAKQSTTKPKLNEKLKAKLDFSQIIVPISNEQPTTPPKPKHCTQPHTHEFGQFDSEKHCLGCRCNLTTGMLCSTKSGCGCFWVESECSSLCLCRNGPRCLKNSLKQAIKVDTKIFQKPNGVCGVRSMQTIPPFTLIIKCDQTKHINGQFSTPQDRHFVLVNSSTTPNASRESWFDSTGSYVGLFSCKTIKKGEEITTFA